MAVAVDPNRVLRYQLKADRLPEGGAEDASKTVWLYRILRSKVRAKIEDGLASAVATNDGQAATINVKNGSVNLDYLRHGLCGVERFNNADGNEIPFKDAPDRTSGGRVASDDFIDQIHEDDQAELARAIQRGNKLSEADRKN